MVPVALTGLGLDPAARPVVVAYLGVLDAGLPVGRRVRAVIVAEVADGLACAVAARADAGIGPRAAAVAAVEEFGDPRALAVAFASELAATTAHRVGVGLVATGPVVGLAWVAAYSLSTGLGWVDQVGALLAAIPALAVVLAVTVPAAVVAAASSGRCARWLPIGSRLAALAAGVAGIGTVTGDVILLAGLIFATKDGLMWTVVAVLPAALSALRLSAALMASHRCWRLRAVSC